MAKKTGLGRGFDALLGDNELDHSAGVSMLRVSQIEINRDQPRKSFDNTSLQELADSITQHGVIQPIVVRPLPSGYYQIIAGERRYKASKMAGLDEIPSIVKDIDDRTATELALVENLQREDLNPVDEANGYRHLIDEYMLTQEEISRRVGKSRSAVTNALRLLSLSPAVLELLETGRLSGGHARALLALEDPQQALMIAERIIKNDLSVRDTEKIIKELKRAKSAPADAADSPPANPVDVYFTTLERKISGAAGRDIKITRSRKNEQAGKLEIRYNSHQDLEGILRIICGDDALENVFGDMQ